MITCSKVGVCPDGVSRSTCSWRRFLAVEYQMVGGFVDAYFATNGMPDHCYYSTPTYPKGSSSDFDAYVFNFVFNVPYKSMKSYSESAASSYVFTNLPT